MDPDPALRSQKLPLTFKRIVLFCAAATLFFSCKKSTWIEVDPAFSQFIDAYTTGVVSKTASVVIHLAAQTNTTHVVGEAVKENLFSWSPSVKGKTVWVDATTVEFKPDEPLKPDQLYEVHFKLGKVTKVPSKFSDFAFSLKTIKPSFTVSDEGLRSSNEKNRMFLTGSIETADMEAGKKIESVLTAVQGGKNIPISWQHNDGAKTHQFTISQIQRKSQVGEIQLLWNGKPADMEVSGEKKIAIPAQGDFKVLEITAVNEAQQYASVQFSDPIAIGQDLTGLLSISGQEEVSYTINGSEVKVFGDGRLDGSHTVNVNAGIKNSWGDALQQGFTANVHFENRLPSVKIHGKGNILPHSGRLVLPFDAVNLKAVDISIIKIFEQNVPQFLQENPLGGDNSLRRVAKPIVQKTLRLDDDKTLDLRKHQQFSLDIDKYLKTEPGAIYRVTLGFRPDYSLFQGVDTTNAASNEDEEGEGDYEEGNSNNGVDDDDAFWDRYDTYYPYGYNWEQRDNPASKSYYNKDRWASRNILASNIGLTAKRSGSDRVRVAVTNILTTEPMKGVELEVLDYQQTIISKSTSDGDGFADIELKRKPYLLIARNGNERGYLKLDDGSALPLSRFDVGGAEVKNGIKGFIYGERGVWRPGDTLYLNCIIEDKEKKLPPDHPVEFSLFTPQGQLFQHLIQSNGEDGFYLFKTQTQPGSPTGNWTARVKVGGAVFEKNIRVETVMPNRLKIQVDFGKEPMLGIGAANSGTIHSQWLFGAPAKNLKAKIDASLVATKTSFAKFAQYEFDNPTSQYETKDKTLFDGSLDESGNGTINPSFETDGAAPGMLNARLAIKVFEPGGSFSIDQVNIPYSPYRSYAGLQLPKGEAPFGYLLSGKQHQAQIVNVDQQGKLIPGSSEVDVQFYRIQWRWWWDNNGGSLSNFTQDEYNKLIKQEKITLTNGKGQWSFGISAREWGRYLVLVKDVNSGHTTGSIVYIDEPGWQSREGNDDQSAATMLVFQSVKEKYAVGEEVQLNIPSSKGGRILVSLENGSRVVRQFWQETQAGQTAVKFKADADMAPNIYATVSLLQPHAQTINDLPIRLYGSIPIIVEDKETELHPQLQMPASIRPETKVQVSVSEKNGKEMTYSLAIVDEGLLDLTRFKTPDPHNAFYAREALGVKSFDLFDEVIGAWGGNLERILTIGGDAEGGPISQKTANRFKPVVQYLGPFHLKAGQRQQQSFTLPSYIGSVRAMVVAAHDGSYGHTEQTVAVKKPLMLLATVPRVLGPGETIQLPATVFAMENNIRNVNVSLQSNPYFEVIGSATQTLSFAQPGEQLVYFNVRVKSNTGIGTFKLVATSGKEKATTDVELEVRNPNPPVTSVQVMTLGAGQTYSVQANPIGSASTSTGMLEVSSVPAMNLQKRLDYLIQYPHGCIEQTTSSVFPQLVLKQLTDLDDYRKAQVDRNIRSAISKLQNFQRSDGGFSYWPGTGESDDWGSTYAGHFLLEAIANGYFVSDYQLQQWKNFQRGKANSWVPSTTNFYGGDLAQSYRLYTLALAKTPELGAMNRLKEFKYLSAEAKWRLAAAYQLAGQSAIALQLISGLPTNFGTRTDPGFTFGSELRDQAMVLETLTIMGRRSQAADLLNTVAARLSDESWYSTQSTAYALVAIAQYCGKNASGAKIVAKATIAGKSTDINSVAYIRQFPVLLKNGKVDVVFQNKGNNNLYIRLITQGQPLAGDSLPPVRNSSLLQMTVNYTSQDGKEINPTQLNQGTDFMARITVKNIGKQGTYRQLALNQIFPSGWEILNARMLGGEGAFKSSASDYQDIRDDRVLTYFNLAENESKTFFIQLNAAYLGRYFLPGVYCEAMYNNNISAGVNGRWVEVLK